MVDQTTRGHQFILKNFGADAAPRATWQIDPFGHSNTQAWLLGAEAGFDSFFWGRMDWQDRGLGLVLGLGLALTPNPSPNPNPNPNPDRNLNPNHAP